MFRCFEIQCYCRARYDVTASDQVALCTDVGVGVLGVLFGSMRGSTGFIGRTASAAVACAAVNTATRLARHKQRKSLKDKAARQEQLGFTNKEPSFVVRNSAIHMVPEEKVANRKTLQMPIPKSSPVLQIVSIIPQIKKRTKATYSTLTSSLPLFIESRANRKQIAA